MQNMKFLLQHMKKKIIQVQRPHSSIIVIIFRSYSMIFLEDELKIQELCANLQSMAIFFFGASGKYAKNLQSEETTAFRHGNWV